MSREPAQLRSDEVVQIAIAVGKAATKGFETFAKRFENHDASISEIFQELVEQECGHGEWLERRYADSFGPFLATLGDQEIKAVIDAANLPQAERFSFDHVSPLMALWGALRVKRLAQEFYRELAAATSDPELKQVLLESESIESDHIHYLKRRIADLAQIQ